MNRASMRDFEQAFLLLRRDSMRQMDRNSDGADTMRAFSHRPFSLDPQPLARNLVARTKPADKVSYAARHGSDEQFDGTHASIMPAILDRLISHHAVGAAGDVVPLAAMICDSQLHGVPRTTGSLAAPHRTSRPAGA